MKFGPLPTLVHTRPSGDVAYPIWIASGPFPAYHMWYPVPSWTTVGFRPRGQRDRQAREGADGTTAGQQGARDCRRPNRPRGAPQARPPVSQGPDGKRTFRATTAPSRSTPANLAQPSVADGDGIFI